MRVPRMTGFPPRIFGSAVMRSGKSMRTPRDTLHPEPTRPKTQVPSTADARVHDVCHFGPHGYRTANAHPPRTAREARSMRTSLLDQVPDSSIALQSAFVHPA